MAGMSSEMQRHAEEPTTGPVLRANKEAKKKQQEEEGEDEREMIKRNEERAKNLRCTYHIGGVRYTGTNPELFAGYRGKRNRKKMHKAAEASVREAGGPDESVTEAGEPEEAELKQSDLLYSQEKLEKKKAKDEEAGKAEASATEAWEPEESVTQAGKAEESATQSGKAEEAVADMNSVDGSFIGEEALNELRKRLATLNDSSGYIRFPEYAHKEIMQLLNPKEHDKIKKRMERAEEKRKASLDIQQKLAKEKTTTTTTMTMKKKKKAKAKVKDEEAGKAEEAVTEAGKAEEAVTQAGKAEASVTEVGKSLTEASKAAAKTSDASNVLQRVRVFEDAEYFGAKFRSFWDRLFSQYCAYDEITTIPAMCYTHGSRGDMVHTMDTMQVISVKVASIEEDIRWPLQVFGMVSARDVVDRKRNIIFHRERDNCQTITEQDPYLTLTGPSRAVVVCIDPSYIEVVLKVKGATESEDKELSRVAVKYRLSCFLNGLYPCELSTLELRFSQVYNSVEATVHVKVTGGSWPDGFKGVFSAATARNESAKVKLLGVGDDGLPVDAADGTVRLWRRVVSVELDGMLKLFISACSPAGDEEEHCEASFVPEKAGFSPGVELKIGSCRMEATVAWSLFCRYR